MSLTTLIPRIVFGLKGDSKNNLQYTDDNTLVYPAGRNVIVYQTEQKSQRFISGTADTDGITALAVSANKKYVAVAERADKAVITVYDLQTLKRRKVLATSEVASKEYVSINFCPDGKYIAAQGGAPDWTLVIWLWEKTKIGSSIRSSSQQGAPLYQASFCPLDPTLISVCGDGIFKTFRISDSGIKQLPSALAKREAQNYLSFAWLSDESQKDRVVVATDSGELFICENGEVRMLLEASDVGIQSEETESSTQVRVECILPYSKGFVCGGSGGTLIFYDKSEDAKDIFKQSKVFRIENNNSKILNLAVTPNEETVACSTENNQIFALGLANLDILRSEEMQFEILAQSFHLKGVNCVDTCIRKPLVATCSSDCTVRIWNYMDKTSELIKFFPEEGFSVAFHPSGLHILVGFADKLRLMNLLIDDIRTYKEFGIKACKECSFSNGGNLFAAVNGNTIQIFNTYTCENIGNLRGHNGKVGSLHWSADDTKLISAGMDGAIYEWTIVDFKRQKENVLKSCAYSSITATSDVHSVIAVGSDDKLKQLDDCQVTKDIETDVRLTKVALLSSTHALFAATSIGTIRSYTYPLNGDFQEYQCVSGAITGLKISHDDNLLFCVSEDSCLFVFDVRDKDGRATSNFNKREKDSIIFSEEVLVTKSDLEDKKQRMSELETQVNELTMQIEYQLRLKELNLKERIKEITEKYTHELESDKTKFELLLQEKNEQEMEYEEKLKQAEERHQATISQLEGQYQQKIMSEMERYQILQQDKDLMSARLNEQNALLIESHERVIQELTEEYEAKLQEELNNLERLTQDKNDIIREFDETKRQLEEDADREIEDLKEKYERRLAAEREIGLRLQGENGNIKETFTVLQKDIEDQREEIKQLYEQKKELYQTISSLEKDIVGLKKEIRERDETIGDKEKRIYDLKKKNQELEKFKFVLDYKIKELKKQIEPRELEIAEMKDQIQQMDQELERYHKNNANLNLTISELKLKKTGLQQEVSSQRKLNADAEAMIRRFHHDLHDTVQYIQDPKALKDSVKHLYEMHVTEQIEPVQLDEDIQNEYNRQREYLEKTVESLKSKLQKNTEIHRSDIMRIIQENVSLIKEINELRREIKGNKAKGQGGLSQKELMRTLPKPDATMGGDGAGQGDLSREIQMQRDMIGQLRNELLSKEELIKQLMAGSQIAPRPVSREKLPPMDGFQAEVVVEGE